MEMSHTGKRKASAKEGRQPLNTPFTEDQASSAQTPWRQLGR